MNERFTTVIETLEAAENEMSELHNLMERLESIDEASWHETQTIADYRKRLSGMGQVVRSMLAKRENAMLEKVRAEHSLHPTAFGVCPHGVNLGNQVCSACEPEKFGVG